MISIAQIKAARALLGWTQEELSSSAEISQRSVRMVEAEGIEVSLKTMQKLQFALEEAGISFTSTVTGEGVFLTKR